MIATPVAPADVRALCRSLATLLEGSGADVVQCDVLPAAAEDLATLDALARLQLTATRLGRRLRLRRACPELRALLALTGLDEVLPLPLEAVGETEEREQALGVEEEGERADPVA